MKRRGLAGALIATVSIALIACSALDSIVPPSDVRTDVKMTPAEARADLAKRSDDLQALIGGVWENHDNFIASGCGRDDRGFYYYGGRARLETVPDIPGTAAGIESWWTEEGYSVTHQVFREDHLLHGVAPNGTVIDVSLGDRRTYFSVDGPCILGDWKRASDDDLAHHRNDFPREPAASPTATPGPAPSPTP